jgi:hypothetical protein
MYIQERELLRPKRPGERGLVYSGGPLLTPEFTDTQVPGERGYLFHLDIETRTVSLSIAVWKARAQRSRSSMNGRPNCFVCANENVNNALVTP